MKDKLLHLMASAVPSLTFLTVVLAILAILKFSGLDFKDFKEYKDELAGLQSLLTSLALAIGGLLAYFRFFAHRIWVKRAELKLEIQVLLDVSGKRHAVSVTIANTGPLPIRVKTIEIEGTDFLSDESQKSFRNDSPFLPQNRKGLDWTIDSTESDQAMFLRPVGDDVIASVYRANLEDASGNWWHGYRAARNVMSDQKPG